MSTNRFTIFQVSNIVKQHGSVVSSCNREYLLHKSQLHKCAFFTTKRVENQKSIVGLAISDKYNEATAKQKGR